MKNIFKLLLFCLLKKVIKIEIYDAIGKYVVSGIEISSFVNNSEKIIITLTDKNPVLFSPEAYESWVTKT